MPKKRVAKKRTVKAKPKPKGMSGRKKAAIAGAGVAAASAAGYVAYRKLKKKRVFPPK
jgi:hypothetical protein